MAKFCNQCGRPLKDGEECNCTKKTEIENIQEQPNKKIDYINYNTGNNYGDGGIISEISNFISGTLDKIYNTIVSGNYKGENKNKIIFRKLIGFSKEDYIKPLNNVYEKGARLTPDLIQPCSDEILVRQYDICVVRSVLKQLWQEGRLLVTNKRVIFRLSGRSAIGKEQTCKEFAIDDIAGIDITSSTKINFCVLIINLIIALIPSVSIFRLFSDLPMVSSILGLIMLIFFLFFLKGHDTFKTIVFSMATALLVNASSIMGNFGSYIAILSIIITIVYLFRASLRPTFAFQILTKCASDSPISLVSGAIIEKLLFLSDVLPGRDSDMALDELGAMINDIQKYGDYGVEKWKAI